MLWEEEQERKMSFMYIYKFGNIVNCNVFDKSIFMFLSLHLFDQKYRKKCKIVKYYYNLK